MDRLKCTLSKPITLSGSLSKLQTLSGILTLKTVGSSYPDYTGDTVIIPTTSDQLLETSNKIIRDDILVEKIPIFETSNEYGVTFIIAS